MRPQVSVFNSLFQGATVQYDVSRPASYQHTIEAVGGYWDASFSVSTSLLEMDEWLQNGIFRHIEVYDESLTKAWQGFVNELSINYGALSITRGPFLDIGNRVNVQYSGVDTSVVPPIVGVEAETGWADNAISQARYGIWQKLLNSGEISSTDAEAIRDTFLAENALPAISHDWSPAQAQQSSVTVHCLGYVHLLTYIYNQTTHVGQVDTNDKILEILAENPNIAWLDYDTTHIDTPASPVQVPRYEYENRLAWELIQDTVSRGDDNANRWLFGVYNDLEVWYEQAPSAAQYHTALSDPGQRIYDLSGAVIPYWNIRPGRWLEFEDLLVGYEEPEDLHDDPRKLFIERVTFSAPNGITLQSGQSSKLSQIIGRLGLGGLS